MSRHVSKADEATSWRRTTALAGNDSSHGYKPGGGAAYHHQHQRPATADPAVHTSSRSSHSQSVQSEPARPKDFSAAEAQTLLEKRWAEVTGQGLEPTCQCQQGSGGGGADGSGGEAAQAAADGDAAAAAGPSFIDAMQKACQANSADAAWDE